MLREHFTACCIGKPMQNTENCKVEGELNNYIDSLLSNHTLLYSLSRFTACCIGKPIQNTENCKVEDELRKYIEYLFSKRTLLYSLSRFPINTNTSDCKVEIGRPISHTLTNTFTFSKHGPGCLGESNTSIPKGPPRRRDTLISALTPAGRKHF